MGKPSTKRPASRTPARRCEAQHPIKTWPYVKRCERAVDHDIVWIEELEQTLDLCDQDYESYLKTLPKYTADEIRQYRAEAQKRRA